jgi:hypothetical protein
VEPFKSSERRRPGPGPGHHARTDHTAHAPAVIPGLRSLPRKIPVHRLIWKDYYRNR